MNRREKIWIAGCAILTVALAVETVALKRAGDQLRTEREKAYWPARLEPVRADSQDPAGFRPTTSKEIPSAYWGEFAEDVHDCGGEQTILVKKGEVLFPDNERQFVETVTWKHPSRIELDTRDGVYSRASYAMVLSEDRDEITLVYTNMKRIIQRCSTRSHGGPANEAETARPTPIDVADASSEKDINSTSHDELADGPPTE